MKQNSWVQSFIAGLISFFTLWLISRTDLLYTNLSSIAANPHYTYPAWIWAILTALYFAWMLNEAQKKLTLNHRRFQILLLIMTVSLILEMILPYSPAVYPLASTLHLLLGYAGFFLLNALFIKLIFNIQYIQPTLYKKMSLFLLLLAMVFAAIFFTFFSINGLLECIYTISMAWAVLYFKNSL